jgi:hypothetical protein
MRNVVSIAAKKPPKSSAERVADYRRRMRAAGLVPRTIWVPDMNDPKVAEEYARQARAIAAAEAQSAEIDQWLEQAYTGHDLGPIPAYRLPKDP